MGKFKPPNVPFVEAFHRNGKHRPSAIVLRSSHTPSTKGSALGVADYWHRSTSPKESCHYVVDESNVYRCVPEGVVAYYGSPTLKGALSINVCHEPFEDVRQWDEQSLALTLDRTAELVADLCLAHRIKPEYLDFEGERRWLNRRWKSRGGIMLKTTGAWPLTEFASLVADKIAMKKG